MKKCCKNCAKWVGPDDLFSGYFYCANENCVCHKKMENKWLEEAEKGEDKEIHDSLVVVLDFVERWNKKDAEPHVATAAQQLEEYAKGMYKLYTPSPLEGLKEIERLDIDEVDLEAGLWKKGVIDKINALTENQNKIVSILKKQQ